MTMSMFLQTLLTAPPYWIPLAGHRTAGRMRCLCTAVGREALIQTQILKMLKSEVKELRVALSTLMRESRRVEAERAPFRQELEEAVRWLWQVITNTFTQDASMRLAGTFRDNLPLAWVLVIRPPRPVDIAIG